MYSEFLDPAKEERFTTFVCMIAAVALIVNMQHIYNFAIKMPSGIGEIIMVFSYCIFILLCLRIYLRWACGYKYSICMEKHIEDLPGDKGTLVLEAGTIIIERRFGKKGTLSDIIRAEEIQEIVQINDNLFKKFRRETPLKNRKFLTNRGKERAHALLYVRENKKHYAIITPSQQFIDKMLELNILYKQ